ncbi:phosphorylase [Leptospira ilyithenensis]|uniref:Phosphorylase n=1 Tax=Leptospira ilyithenensis TaxID=2484901 RepID=A0A4R9LNW4_9LEPT|nr:phosphorylase [Leptospira ilyithenensis]TGN06921.1 phosphorylase [Leptospira ilyithenensis]
MGVITFALVSEAKPWIRALGAKPDPAQGRFRYFRTPEHILAVTGVGKLAAALALGEISHKIPKEERKYCRVWNLGVAGTTSPNKSLGDFFWINRITDDSTKKEYFPERIESFSLKAEAHLTTFDRPVSFSKDQETKPFPNFRELTEEESKSVDLVDMEASGFFEAASLYFELEQIQVGKIISDHLEGTFCTEDKVTGYTEKTIEPLLSDFLKPFDWEKEELLPDSEKTHWRNIGESLNFTESMLVELEKTILYFKLRHPDSKIPLPQFPPEEKKLEKRMAKEIFQSWLGRLLV